MEKKEQLSKYSDPDDRLLIARVLDKIEITKTTKKLSNTDFLDERQKALLESFLRNV